MLEATDKAFASILETINQFSKQVSPDVITSFGNVAMLDAQGDLVAAKIWLLFGVFIFIAGFAMFLKGLLQDEDIIVAGVIGLLISFVVIGCSVNSLISPLNNAAAQDGKVALAAKAMQKIMTIENK